MRCLSELTDRGKHIRLRTSRLSFSFSLAPGNLAPELADAAAALRDGVSFRYDILKLGDCKVTSCFDCDLSVPCGDLRACHLLDKFVITTCEEQPAALGSLLEFAGDLLYLGWDTWPCRECLLRAPGNRVASLQTLFAFAGIPPLTAALEKEGWAAH